MKFYTSLGLSNLKIATSIVVFGYSMRKISYDTGAELFNGTTYIPRLRLVP